MDIQRAILLLALSLVLILLYQRWLDFQAPKVSPAALTASRPASQAGASAYPDELPEVPRAPSGTSTDSAAPPEAPGVASDKADEAKKVPQVMVTTDVLRVKIDPNGGNIEGLWLLEYPVAVDRPNNPFQLMKHEITNDGANIFTSQSGLIGADREYPNHKTHYRVEQTEYKLKDGADRVTVVLHWTSPDQVRYTKRFTFFRNSYRFEIDYLVDNRSDTAWKGYIYGQFLRTPVESSGGFFLYNAASGYTGGAIYTPEDKFEKIDFDQTREDPLKRKVVNGWVAMLTHYFVAGWFPRADQPYSFYARALNHPVKPRYNIGLNSLQAATIAPGKSGRLGLDIYAGPKDPDRLDEQAAGFGLTVDYGWLTPLSAPLFWVLDKIHGVVGNWGWAIIVLTCLIKLALYPLSATSYKSMAKMKKLQPRLQTLKDRFGDDRTKMNQAMMEIYKKEKVNPLGGCLPIAVQIPVFIALYWMLRSSVELRQAPWIFWIQDLSAPDPLFVMPVLMGITQMAQQLLNPAPMDPVQKKVMMALPLFFTFLFLYFPAGLVLYYLVNNLLSITQQWYVNKHVIG